MDELVDFIRARLDEDQQAAEEAQKKTTTTRRRVGGEWVEDTVQPPEWRRSVWPPARVLREIDAKRRVVDLMEGMLAAARGDSEVDHYGGLGAAEDTLELLALPYADRPDYREEWRP